MVKENLNTKNKGEKRFKFILLFLAVVFVCVATVLFWLQSKKLDPLFVNFFDVGQGDSALIQTPRGHNILIDGGESNIVTKKIGSRLHWWDREIDLMILTHPHEDHLGGLISVIKEYRVARIAYTGVVHNSPVYLEWLKLVKEENIPLILIDRKQKIVLDENCYLNILYPDVSIAGKTAKNINDTSIVSLLECEQARVFFSGDMEKETEKVILKDNDIRSDIYKASHHGSDTSNSKDLMDKIKPKMIVISVGQENKFGHPDPKVLDVFKNIGSNVYRTDIDKDIIFEIHQGNIIKK